MSRFNNTESTVVEPTIGDGNCCFNAFALALTRRSVLGHPNFPDLSDDHYFVMEASKALKLPSPHTWAHLKKYLSSDLSHEFRHALQKILSPIFRAIAIKQFFNYPEEKLAHQHATLVYLKEEFERYRDQRASLAVDDAGVDTRAIGDTYISHTFIRNKFAELFQANLNEVALDKAISTWWQTEGQNNFLDNLAIPARSASDHDSWAGPTELAPLGIIFGVNLEITAKNASQTYKMLLHSANGKLPAAMTAEVAAALQHRNIIDDQNERNWSVFSEAELIARLNAVPNLDVILDDVGKLKYRAPIPHTWDSVCVDELLARKLIAMDQQTKQFLLIVQPDQLVEHSTEYPHKNSVIKAYSTGPDRYRSAPTIYLQNQDALHWSNLATESDLRPSLPDHLEPSTPPTEKREPVPQPTGVTTRSATKREAAALESESDAPRSQAAQSKRASTPVPPSVAKKPRTEKREAITPESTSSTTLTQPPQSEAQQPKAETTTQDARSVRSPSPVEPNSARPDSSSASAANYVLSYPEVEVNAGVNRAFDLLNQSRSYLTDEEVAHNFEEAFEQFSTILHDYNHHKIDMRFFKQEKQRIIDSVEDKIQEAKTLKK
jgi:hypothetical protein